MLVKDVMTSNVDMIEPTMVLRNAAAIMRDDGVGSLPVAENNRLVGMITDRDIVVGAVADGADPNTATVGQTMSQTVYHCFDDQPVEEAAASMGEKQVRRLPVLNRDMQLIGIVSLGDISSEGDLGAAGEALEKISA